MIGEAEVGGGAVCDSRWSASGSAARGEWALVCPVEASRGRLGADKAVGRAWAIGGSVNDKNDKNIKMPLLNGTSILKNGRYGR
jgi:hypothetical protein